MKLRVAGTANVVDAEPAVGSALPRGVRVARDGKTVWVAYRGETYRIEEVQKALPGQADVEHALVAPMPGRIAKVFVAEGDAVTKGKALLVLEAMKMEHEIKAPYDGRVAKLAHGVGDMVGLGDTLAEIERS